MAPLAPVPARSAEIQDSPGSSRLPQADTLLNSGKAEEARPLLEAEVEEFPGESKAWRALGYCEEVLKAPALAAIYYRKAAELDSSDQYSRGRIEELAALAVPLPPPEVSMKPHLHRQSTLELGVGITKLAMDEATIIWGTTGILHDMGIQGFVRPGWTLGRKTLFQVSLAFEHFNGRHLWGQDSDGITTNYSEWQVGSVLNLEMLPQITFRACLGSDADLYTGFFLGPSLVHEGSWRTMYDYGGGNPIVTDYEPKTNLHIVFGLRAGVILGSHEKTHGLLEASLKVDPERLGDVAADLPQWSLAAGLSLIRFEKKAPAP